MYVNACVGEYVFCVYACMQMFGCRCVHGVYILAMKCPLTMHPSEGCLCQLSLQYMAISLVQRH